MARIDLTLYSNADGTPLAGHLSDLSFNAFIRVNADTSTDDLIASAPTFVEIGGGMYRAESDNALSTPGSEIRYIIDAGLNATARFYDGVIVPGQNGSPSFPVSPLDDTQDVILRQGDRAPSFTDTLRDAAGNPVTIGVGDTVTFSMRSDQGGERVIDAAAVTVVDGPAGLVLYAWEDGSTDAPGNFLAEMQLTQGGLVSTFPYGRQLVVRVIPTV